MVHHEFMDTLMMPEHLFAVKVYVDHLRKWEVKSALPP
jgi:hypothetical protein